MQVTIKEGLFPVAGGTGGHLATGVFVDGSTQPSFVFEAGPAGGAYPIGNMQAQPYKEDWSSAANVTTLNVSDPAAVASALEDEQQNFAQNSADYGAPGYSVLGQNSNTYDVSGLSMAGVSAAAIGNVITQLKASSGINIVPAANVNTELEHYMSADATGPIGNKRTPPDGATNSAAVAGGIPGFYIDTSWVKDIPSNRSGGYGTSVSFDPYDLNREY